MSHDRPPQANTKLFYLIGGYDTLRQVHKLFYDKVYTHPWLGKFFSKHDQQLIENQQTDFMAQKFGGPRNYLGKEPQYAHEHMYITQELFDLRQCILRTALEEAKVEAELIERWLSIDSAFQKQVVKQDMESFMQVHTFKSRLVFQRRN